MQEGSSPQEYVCVATFLPLKSWLYLVPFLAMTSKVRKQAQNAEGIVNHIVRADFPKRHFWTLSVWKDGDSMRRFVASEPHATAMERFSIWAGAGAAFVEWKRADRDVSWQEALERLKNPTFYYRHK